MGHGGEGSVAMVMTCWWCLVTCQALIGDNMTAQKALLREHPDVVVSTPAKLVAHLDAGNLNLKDTVETLGE